MTSKRGVSLAVLCGAGGLAACAQDAPRLPPGGVGALDGTYRGQSALTYGSDYCPETTPYALIVRAGQVTGEVFEVRDPQVVKTRFHAELDDEGRIGEQIFVGGDEALLKGAFAGNRFEGSVEFEQLPRSDHAAAGPGLGRADRARDRIYAGVHLATTRRPDRHGIIDVWGFVITRGDEVMKTPALAFSALFAGVTIAGASAQQPQQQKPNIILIVSDDTGYGDLGPYGGGEGRGMPTPNIDRLANEGMHVLLVLRPAELHARPRRHADRPHPQPQRHDDRRLPGPGRRPAGGGVDARPRC